MFYATTEERDDIADTLSSFDYIFYAIFFFADTAFLRHAYHVVSLRDIDAFVDTDATDFLFITPFSRFSPCRRRYAAAITDIFFRDIRRCCCLMLAIFALICLPRFLR